MTGIDWAVLISTLAFIVGYGSWKTRKSKNIEGYLLGGKEAKWSTIGLSVMATQASAITFLSTPGKGFDSGMEFVQFYLGMPIALVILSVTVIPIFYRLKVYTAYEYLEGRFDLNTRLLTAFLFMLQRGLAAGLTIYAPAIILSSTLGWNLAVTNILVGVLVIIYTVSGGTKAVSLTQKWQMGVIMLGMFIAFGILLNHIFEFVTFDEALTLAGDMGRMEVINYEFDINSKYNIWSAFTGGIFLFLSYFGTDQSQVQRYLSGRSIKESRLGLMFNGLLKVPMQFFIVFVGVMVFVFYQFEREPVYFDHTLITQLEASEYAPQFEEIKAAHDAHFTDGQALREDYLSAIRQEDAVAQASGAEALRTWETERRGIHNDVRTLAKQADIEIKSNETDYVFITFILDYLPIGLVGLLIAVIFSAAMSSTAGELNALASTITVDYYKRLRKKPASEKHMLRASRLFTLGWGIVAIIFSFIFSMADNLIEVVNIVGSVFYGVILGIFLLGFYVKFIRGNTVFIAGIISQLIVFGIYYWRVYLPEDPADQLGYLWLNFIGCALVFLVTFIVHFIRGGNPAPKNDTT